MRESSSSLAMASATTSRSVSSERAFIPVTLFRRVLKQDRVGFQSRTKLKSGATVFSPARDHRSERAPRVSVPGSRGNSVLRAGDQGRANRPVVQVERRGPVVARSPVQAGEEEREQHENTFLLPSV